MRNNAPRVGVLAAAILSLGTLMPLCAMPHNRARSGDQPTAQSRLSIDLQALLEEPAAKREATVPVIVQGAGREALRAALGDATIASARRLYSVRGFAVEVSLDDVERLALLDSVTRVTLDRRVVASTLNGYGAQHVRATTGGAQVIGTANFSFNQGQFYSASLAALSPTGPNGSGIGIYGSS
jgi:hypothetical protein